MTAQILPFRPPVLPDTVVVEPPPIVQVDGGREALQDILRAVPSSEINRLIVELWCRGFKIVPLDEDDD